MRTTTFWRSCVWSLGLAVWIGLVAPSWAAGAEASAQAAGAEPTEQPAWKGSKAGLSDATLAPWTPVVAAAKQVSVWGRTYRFDTLPLPASIVARDAELLAGPITLVGTADGKPIAWEKSSCSLVDARPQAAVYSIRATSGSLVCEGTVRVEYDGMFRCDVRMSSDVNTVKLERLALEIPLRAKHSQYLHTWPGQWGSVSNSRALPKEGHHSPFKPFVWLGDASRGLAWFSESDRNFFLAENEPVLDIRPEGDKVLFRVNLVSVPQKMEHPLEYTFGFQATPVKPAWPDAWDRRIVHMGEYGIEEKPFTRPDGTTTTVLDHLAASGARTICFHEHWTDVQNYTKTTHGKELKKLVAACHARKIQFLLYFGYEMSDIAPEWEQYSQECLVFPRAGGYKRKPEQTAYIVCYRSPWQDFLADGVEKVIQTYGIDGVYLDGTSEPWGCANQRHGCGYPKPDGTVGKTYPFFATRAMMKRIYTIVKEHNPEGQVNVHQSTCMTIPTLAFATSYWDGEQLQGLNRDKAALDVLPLDAFCAEFMGHNWGVPAELLWYANGPFRRVEAVTLGLLHDIPTRPGSMADLAVSSRLWKTHDEFGCREATWLPYWEIERQSPPVVRTEPAAVKLSLHNRPGRGVLAVIANVSHEACQAKVNFDLRALGQPAEVNAQDVIAGRDIPCSAGQLEIPLGPLEHMVVWLKGK